MTLNLPHLYFIQLICSDCQQKYQKYKISKKHNIHKHCSYYIIYHTIRYLLSGCHGNLVSIDRHNNFSLIVAGNILNRKKWFDGEGKYNNDNRKQLLFFTEQEGFQEPRRFRSKERAARTEQIHTKNSIVFAPDTL